jgi:hypothetical protein
VPLHGRLTELVLGGRHLGQLRPGALQRAVDRRGRGAEQVGDSSRPTRQHVPQDQDRALPRRQVLQRGHQRQPDAAPRRHDRGRITRIPHYYYRSSDGEESSAAHSFLRHMATRGW